MNPIKVMKPSMRQLAKVSCVLGVSLFSVQALAVSLTNVNFKTLNNGKTQVHLSFDGPAPEMDAYAKEYPARLVFDLKKTKSKLARRSYKVNSRDVSSAVAVSAGDLVRLQIDMKELKPYSSSSNGNNLYFTIGNGSSSKPIKMAANTSKRPAASSNSNAVTRSNNSNSTGNRSGLVRNNVQSVTFNRTAQGAGDVEITLANPNFTANARRSGNAVYVDIPGAQLSRSVQKVKNLSQFGTVVKSIHSQIAGDKVRVKINTGADFGFEGYQIDNKYVVSFSPRQGASYKANSPASRSSASSDSSAAYSGKRLSLNFQNIEVRSVLQLIADFTDLNLVASDSVQGNITLRLKDVPWDQALDIVLKAKGLDKRREGNVLLVAPAQEIADRELKELEASQKLEALAPLMTEHIKIKYADATEIFNIFLSGNNDNRNDRNNNSRNNNETGPRGQTDTAQSTASILSPRGSVIVDERTNSLFVTETAERLANLKALINKIDIPIRQVMVEARIVLASKSAGKNLGIRWGGNRNVGNSTISGGGLNNAVVDLGVASTTALTIGRVFNSGLLNLELQALEESGDGEVISRPKVITGDKQEALIKSGTEVPFQTIGQNGAVTTEFKEVVLELGVTPYITPDGRVIMDLEITQDSVGENIATATGNVPRIETTELTTQVLASDGETIVLGGLFTENNTVTKRKTPLLGDLPVVGGLFSSTLREAKKSETLIFITPKIVNDKLIN